jgi:hypothetical protein
MIQVNLNLKPKFDPFQKRKFGIFEGNGIFQTSKGLNLTKSEIWKLVQGFESNKFGYNSRI